MAATVTSKGQVTIPKRVRDQLGLRAGSKVEFVLVKGHAVLEPVGSRGADALAGSLRAYSKALAGRPHREIMEEVRREVANEAVKEGLPSRRKRHP
jgi:AbrB family looped-hinge helix DNA binding protein